MLLPVVEQLECHVFYLFSVLKHLQETEQQPDLFVGVCFGLELRVGKTWFLLLGLELVVTTVVDFTLGERHEHAILVFESVVAVYALARNNRQQGNVDGSQLQQLFFGDTFQPLVVYRL